MVLTGEQRAGARWGPGVGCSLGRPSCLLCPLAQANPFVGSWWALPEALRNFKRYNLKNLKRYRHSYVHNNSCNNKMIVVSFVRIVISVSFVKWEDHF